MVFVVVPTSHFFGSSPGFSVYARTTLEFESIIFIIIIIIIIIIIQIGNLPLLQMSGETGCAELCCPQVMAPSAQPSDPSARRESNSDPGEFLAGQRSTCTALKVGKGAYGPRNTAGCFLESHDKFGLKGCPGC